MVTAAGALERLARAVQDEQLGVYGVHVRVGTESASHRWRSDDRENLYSLSKGVCAIAAGIAIEERLLTLDTTVAEVLPDLVSGDAVEQVSLRHLLSMTSGIDFP
jgi:CubicO group peptidase (beta-lactamase class C family)